ncbi:MAG: TlpA family protein disulfide reductase [Saprospiraceae bacterium]|nr:TlpA family protein disulfide reductase [Saprospiraceae bacterium]
MGKLLFSLLFAILFGPLLHAQAATNEAEALVVALNQKITGIRQGYFDCHFLRKSAFYSDTLENTCRVWFFRNNGTEDSVARFIVTGYFSGAYDGENYYHFNNKHKSVIITPTKERGGIMEVLSGKGLHLGMFKHYLAEGASPPFKPERYGESLLDTIVADKESFLRLVRLDSFANDVKMSNKDPELIRVRETLEITLPDLDIRKKTEWIHFSLEPQYTEQHLSPICPLPDTVTFELMLNLDSLRREGWTSTQQITSFNAPARPALIAAGDTLPHFALPDLNGRMVNTLDMLDGLLLLDFWYKGCAPCLMAMPFLEDLHQKYSEKGVTLYGVNDRDKDANDLVRFLVRRAVSYPTLLDAESQLSTALRVTGYPTFVLVDVSTRKVLYAQSGVSLEIMTTLESIIEAWRK